MKEILNTYESLIEVIGEMMGMGSTTVMAPYATPVVGQTNPSKYQKQSKGSSKKAMLGYKYRKTWESISEIAELCEGILRYKEK